MLAPPMLAKPMRSLAFQGAAFRIRFGADALGNALGQGLVDAASGPGYTAEEMAGDYARESNRFAAAAPNRAGASDSWDMAPVNYSLAGGGRVQFGTGSVEAQPSPDELQAAFRASERDYRSATERSVAGAGYRAQPGDSISPIVGSSDPQAIGNFMLANNLTSDRIEAGRNYFRPDSATAYSDARDLGQFALNQGNERISAARRSEMQRELNRFAAMSEAPVWNMRDASAASMARAVDTEEWFKTASVSELHAAGYQTMSASDPAAARNAEVRRESLLNYLEGQGSMALGGMVSAGVMIGTGDVVAASATTDAMAPLDSLLAPMGGSTATRLASGARTRTVPLGFSQQSEFVAFGDSLYAGLEGAGFKNAQAGFQGSSVTGRAFKSPYAPFDVGRVSDYDIALSSPELFDQAKAVGIGLRQQGTRTGPLMPEHLDRLGLTDLSSQLSQQARRPVNFMIYRSIDDALGRSPTILVPKGPQ